MEQNIVVCADCGDESTEEHNRRRGEGEHDWSDADPLSRLEARISAMADAGVIKRSDSEEWQWVEIELERDVATASEIAGGAAQEEGFAFVGIDDGPTVRFNRQK